MRDKLIFIALLLAALLPGILAFAVPSASAETARPSATASTHARTAVISSRRCTFHLKWSNGEKGIVLHPFGKAEFDGVTCNNVLQTVIRVKNGPTGSCYRAPASPATNKRSTWVESDGPSSTLYCDQWYRTRCNASGCQWHKYQKLSNTSAPAIHLTAYAHPASEAPRALPQSARDPSANRIACGTACYHIREKNGAQFFMGFNSDQPTYWLRNKGAFDGRDFVLEGVSGTCTDGVSCFEAKMITLNNLEVVTTNCQQSGGNTFQLQNTGGTTGDVYKFITDNNGDNSIKSRYCGDFVSFQGALDDPLQLGSNPGQYWRVLYFAGS